MFIIIIIIIIKIIILLLLFLIIINTKQDTNMEITIVKHHMSMKAIFHAKIISHAR